MPALEYSFMVFWYIIIMICMAQYAMLDGFDLGVGILMPTNKSDMERRICYNAIGPVWDGNEVWLVVLIGGLFAGFPLVYATLMSAFYTPVMILVFALIFRAVAIEFRSKRPHKWWRAMWDLFFFLASLLIAFAVGVALGNFVEGIPLNKDFEYTGGVILTFLRPFPLLVGVFSLSLFILHAIMFVVMKTEGSLQQRYKSYALPVAAIFFLLYLITTTLVLTHHQHMITRFLHIPWLFIIPVVNMLVILFIPFALRKHRYGRAFIASCLNIFLLISLYAVGTFPELIHSSTHPEYSLTIFNTSASYRTLLVLAVITVIGIPLVIAYIGWVYTIFRGKVIIDDHSY